MVDSTLKLSRLRPNARILLPRFDTYGDIVLLQGFLQRLAETVPTAEIHLLVRHRYAELQPLCSSKLHWHVTQLEPTHVLERPLRDEDDIRSLLDQPWDLMLGTVFNFTWLDERIAEHLSSHQVPCVRITKAGVLRNHSAVTEIPVPESTHETEKYRILFEHLTGDSTPLPKPRLQIPAAIDHEVRMYLTDLGLAPGRYLVCVAGGAMNNPLNSWNSEGLAACAAKAEIEFGLRSLFAGHQSEVEAVNRAVRATRGLGATPHAWIGGPGGMPFLAGLLSHCRLYFGADSGPMHIAQALQRPVVAVFGGWTWPRFAPVHEGVACLAPRSCFGCGSQCFYDNTPCISSVQATDVYRGVQRVLEGQLHGSFEVIEAASKQQYSETELVPLVREHRKVAEKAEQARLLRNALTDNLQYVQYLQQQLADREAHIRTLQSGQNDAAAQHALQQQQADHHGRELVSAQHALHDAQQEVVRLENLLAKERAAIENERQLHHDALNHALECEQREHHMRLAAETSLAQQAAELAALVKTERTLSMDLDQLRSHVEELRRDPFAWLVESRAKAYKTLELNPTGREGLISVIIPVFNGAAFIERCLESVWAQRLPSGYSLEIFICDDGSKDTSRDVITHFSARSPYPLRLLTHPNRANLGVSATRNLGIAESQGEFIALLDVDDTWLPNKLARQLEYFNSNPQVQAVCSYGYNKDPEGKPVVGWNGSTIAGDYTHVPPPGDLLPPYTFELLMRGDPIVNSTVMMRRRALAETGGYTAVMAHQAEDWLLFLKLSLYGEIHLIAEPLIEYLVHSASYTAQYMSFGLAYGARVETMYQLLHWMLQHPDFRVKAQWVYRRNLPLLLSSKAGAYQLIENAYRSHHGHTIGVADFEAHLCGVQVENERLWAYRRHIEAQFDVLRRIPGVVRAYHFALSIYRRFRD